jgi:hypothetical protein
MLGKGQGINIICLPETWLEVIMNAEDPENGHIETSFLYLPVSSNKF